MLDEESYKKLRKQAVEESTTISDLLRTGVDHVAARSARLIEARKKGTHTLKEWRALRNEFNGICVRCWKESDDITKDHIIPISMGGSDAIDNLQPICRSCNSMKLSETVNWVKIRRYARTKGMENDEHWFCHPCMLWLPKAIDELDHEINEHTFKEVDGI